MKLQGGQKEGRSLDGRVFVGKKDGKRFLVDTQETFGW